MVRHILVFGATGATGRTFTRIALARSDPPALTLYVRSRAKLELSPDEEKRVRIVEGGLTDENMLREAVSGGVDAVVSFLGAYVSLSAFLLRTKTTPIADSFPTILSIMRESGVRRILVLSTPSFAPPPPATELLPLKWSLYGMFPKIAAPQGNAEMVEIAQTVARADDLDWTVFRVPILTDEDADLPLAVGLLGPEFQGGLQVSRRSIANWMLDELEAGVWIKQAPVLANY
ncbi:unnamed protein product [Mycena citricolor]|uniref:NAD(P)-binding domain-containing protein n=1 Tax=Mycena citricolor TaxID=2018698 RepID=A0AAD2K0J2_9AGAR|nr:unnamed protein product [Mycena citricolor]